MMARATLSQGRRLERGPRRYADSVPPISVIAGSLVSILPIVAAVGWWPDVGLLILVAWRMLRADAWPAWWAAPLGLANDFIVGNPIGLSVFLWSAIMLTMDILDRRTMWRDYWVEWAIASAIIALCELAEWQAGAIMGAPVPFRVSTGPAILLSVLAFPLAGWLVAALDRWRLRR